MSKFIIILALFATLAACQEQPTTSVEEDSTTDVVASVSKLIIDGLAQAVQYFLRVFEVKTRLFKLVRGLITRENLITLRRVLELGTRTSNFLLRFLPDEQSSASQGLGGLASVLLGSTVQVEDNQDETTTEDSITAEESKLTEFQQAALPVLQVTAKRATINEERKNQVLLPRHMEILRQAADDKYDWRKARDIKKLIEAGQAQA